MVQLLFENLVGSPPADGQPREWIKFTNHAGISPIEQWFYHWVRQMDLAAPFPNLDKVKAALQAHLPQRTKRYSRNVPDLESGESWLRFVLATGELIRLSPSPGQPDQIIAVHPNNMERFALKRYETSCAPEFSAVRKDLGIDKHWTLLVENLSEKVLELDTLRNALIQQAEDPAECAIIRL